MNLSPENRPVCRCVRPEILCRYEPQCPHPESAASENMETGRCCPRSAKVRASFKRFIIAAMLACLVYGGPKVLAYTNTFSFEIYPEQYSLNYSYAKKDDNEQTAYVTPTSISGSGAVWVTVYDSSGQQCVVDIGIASSEVNVRKTGAYYITGVAGDIYHLGGGDPEWQVTSSLFYVTGRWTP